MERLIEVTQEKVNEEQVKKKAMFFYITIPVAPIGMMETLF